MPNHFTSIGVPVNSQADLDDVLARIGDHCESFTCPAGVYASWSSPDGAQLWLQIDRDNRIVGFNPAFAGSSRSTVRLTHDVHRPDDNGFDGGVHCWALTGQGEDAGKDFPFVLDLVDFAAAGKRTYPCHADVAITAFAHDLEAYPDEQAFHARENQEIRFATESFIPSGLFGPDGAAAEVSGAYAIFAGRVLDCDLRTNALFGERYQWLRVKVQALTVDVVCDPAAFEGTVVKGGVVLGEFWLSGRILEVK